VGFAATAARTSAAIARASEGHVLPEGPAHAPSVAMLNAHSCARAARASDILKINNLLGFDKLVKLYLDNNVIVKIEHLDHLTNLEWLDLSFNNIGQVRGVRCERRVTRATRRLPLARPCSSRQLVCVTSVRSPHVAATRQHVRALIPSPLASGTLVSLRGALSRCRIRSAAWTS
jgi:hypothetical protein